MQPKQITDLYQQLTANTISGWEIFQILLLNIMFLVVIKFMFDTLDHLASREKGKYQIKDFINYSSIIGLVERLLYIIGFWTNNLQLITIVIAVKTIMRFSSINENAQITDDSVDNSNHKLTVEKYILGTMLNLLLSLVIVFLYK